MPGRVLVLDTETTGFSPEWDRIVEIAAIEVVPRTGAVTSELHRILNPDRSIPQRVVDIHGITNERVRSEPRFSDIADELCSFLQDATLAMHNASFDARMLDAEFARSNRPSLAELGTKIIDTVEVARSVYPLLARHNLNALCGHLDVSLHERTLHGAAIDVRLLAATFPKIAAEYDRWMSAIENACAAELDEFQGALAAFCDGLLAAAQNDSAEEVDQSLSIIATASRYIGKEIEALEKQCHGLVSEEGWCCKSFSARWETTERMSWKAAQESLLPGMDLSAYRTMSVSQTVTPMKAIDVESSLVAICTPLKLEGVISTLHCAVRALCLLKDVARKLDHKREYFREELLQFVADGYAPSRSSIRTSSRSSIDYERACNEHAPGADNAGYISESRALKAGRRDTLACGALFG